MKKNYINPAEKIVLLDAEAVIAGSIRMSDEGAQEDYTPATGTGDGNNDSRTNGSLWDAEW